MNYYDVKVLQTSVLSKRLLANSEQEAIQNMNDMLARDLIDMNNFQLIDATVTASEPNCKDNIIKIDFK